MASAASAFGSVLLLVSTAAVVQGKNDWGVTYRSTEACGLEGSTLELRCTYTKPDPTRVVDTFWVTKIDGYYEELRKASEFAGRVQESCDGNSCSLRITDLRQTDSGVYYFWFNTDMFEAFTGKPGVNVSVTVLQVQVVTSTVQDSYADAELRCLSSCTRPSYVWFKNGQEVTTEGDSYRGRVDAGDAVACALKGRDDYKSASVYAPELPSVSVVPSGQIVENSSVTLTCSSDANPAAHYSWYKRDSHPEPIHQGPQLVFSSIQASDSGQFYCRAENQLGRRTSGSIYVDVGLPGFSILVVNIIRLSLVVLASVLLLFVVTWWIRKKKTLSRDVNEGGAMKESQSGPDYENTSVAAAQTDDTEQQEELV